MATVQVNGVDLCVTRYEARADGQRPVVVFIHGLTANHSGLGFTLGMPLSTAAHVVLYDLRGHGRSQAVRSGFRIADHVADLVGLLDALDITSPVHLVACSYGGVIGLQAAVDHPERVASLTLLDALLPYEGWGEALANGLSSMAQQLANAGDYTAEEAMDVLQMTSRRQAVGYAKRVERLLLETTLPSDSGLEKAFDHADYARVRCPVLAVYGDESHVYWLVDELRAALPAAEIHTISGADHLATFLHTPILRQLINEFVTGHETADAVSGAARPQEPSMIASPSSR